MRYIFILWASRSSCHDFVSYFACVCPQLSTALSTLPRRERINISLLFNTVTTQLLRYRINPLKFVVKTLLKERILRTYVRMYKLVLHMTIAFSTNCKNLSRKVKCVKRNFQFSQIESLMG